MIRNVICFIFIVLPAFCFSQKEDNTWMLGYGGGTDSSFTTFTMDFRFTPPKLERRYQDFYMTFTNASICDSLGNLILYTNGDEVKNQYDEVINNGAAFQFNAPTGLLIDQGAILLPVLGTSQYIMLLGEPVIFNDPLIGGALNGGISPLTYSLIDNVQNGGQGDVIIKKEILVSDTLGAGNLTATKHANGRDWWVISKKHNTNRFHKILITQNQPHHLGTFVEGDSIRCSTGQAAFSPDGRWYAKNASNGTLGGTGLNSFNEISLYEFDRCEGNLTNHIHEILGVGVFRCGVAFSPDSRFLYANTRDTIYQYDLTASDILGSRVAVAGNDGFVQVYNGIELSTSFNKMLLAPNGKIYISTSANTKYLHVIDQPNVLGVGCNVLQHDFLLPAFTDRGMPNLPNFRLFAEIGSPCDTLRPLAQFTHLPDALDVVFTDESQRTPTEWLWTFGDGDSSTLQNPQHLYAQSGTYEVCLIVSNEAGSDTVCQMVAIIVDGIEQLFIAQQIKISPNPTTGNLTITLPETRSEDWEIQLYDTFGRVLLEKQLPQGVQQEEIWLGDFSSGVYFYKIKNGQQLIKVGKVVKE